MTAALPIPCDGCDKPLQRTEVRIFRSLSLCAACFISENAALTTPVVSERTSASSNTIAVAAPAVALRPTTWKFSALAIQQEISKRIQDFISMNHMDFFNQEISEVKDLSVEELRTRIEEMAEAYFGAEAEAIRKKTKMQAASQVFNDKTSKLTIEEREAMRLRDSTYTPVLANPLKSRKPRAAKAPGSTPAASVKGAATKKSLEDGLASLFGDRAEEALKKLLG